MKQCFLSLLTVLAWLSVCVDISHSQTSTGCDAGENLTKYGQKIGEMFETIARSNGACAGNGNKGKWQCVEFVERYYYHANDWSGDANAWFNQNEADERNLERRINGGAFPPVPGNVICFSGGAYGHVGIVKSINFVTNTVTVVDQNRSRSHGEHTHALTVSGSSQNRTYSVAGFGDDPTTPNVIEGYTVLGWLGVKTGSRHRDLVQNGSQDQAFIDAYNRHGSKLGWAFDKDGRGSWIVDWHAVKIQRFLQPDLQKDHYGIDGETAIILSPSPPPYANNAYLVKEGFWCWYKEHNGSINMGTPTSEEFPYGSGRKQTFQKGYLVWNGQQGTCDNVITAYTLNGIPIGKHMITVNSSPSGATVFNEGLVRIASFQEPMQEGFRYWMNAELSGYENTPFEFTVGTQNSTVSILLPTDTQTGLLNLVTDPSGAQLYRDGSSWPAAGILTPLIGQELAVGNYTFTAQKSGYGPTTIGFVIENGSTTEVQERLNPASFPLTLEAESMQGTGYQVSGGRKLAGTNNWYIFENFNLPEMGRIEFEVVARAEWQVNGYWPKLEVAGPAQDIAATDFASYFYYADYVQGGQFQVNIKHDEWTRNQGGHSIIMDRCILRYVAVPPPAAPSNCVAVFNGGTATIMWADNSNNEQGFKIEYQFGQSPNWSSFTAPANATSAQYAAGSPSNELYRFRVKSYVASGAVNSALSNETPGKVLSVPTNLGASVLASSKINLSWSDNSSLEDGFKIERKPSSGSFSEIASTVASATSFVDSVGLSPSTTYTYRIRAYAISDGTSPHVSNYSNESSATTPSFVANLIKDPECNGPFDPNGTSGWIMMDDEQSGTHDVSFSTSSPLSGSSSLLVYNDVATTNWTGIKQKVDLIQGHDYRVSFVVKSDNGGPFSTFVDALSLVDWQGQGAWFSYNVTNIRTVHSYQFNCRSTATSLFALQFGPVVGNVRVDSISVIDLSSQPSNPILSVSPTTLNLGSASSGTLSGSFSISNAGGGALSWTNTHNGSITLSPLNGTNNATINVSVNVSGLYLESHTDHVFVASNGGADTVDVSYMVTQQSSSGLIADSQFNGPFVQDGTYGGWIMMDDEQSGTHDVSFSTSSPLSGSSSLLVYNNTVTGSWTGAKQKIDLIQGHNYRVSFIVKSESMGPFNTFLDVISTVDWIGQGGWHSYDITGVRTVHTYQFNCRSSAPSYIAFHLGNVVGNSRLDSIVVTDLSAPEPNAVIGLWNMSGALGSEAKRMNEVTSIPATEMNLVSAPDHHQISNEAYFFNGSGYLQTDLATQLDGLQKLTVEAWVKTTATSHDQILGRWQNGGRSFVFNWFSDHRLYVYIANNGTDTGVNSNAHASLNRDTNWHHLAFVYDGTVANAGRIKIYFDGQPQTTTVTGTIPATLTSAGASYPLIIGNYEASTSGPPHAGEVDYVRVQNIALTADDILSSYESGAEPPSGGGGDPPSVIGHWKMTGAAGSTEKRKNEITSASVTESNMSSTMDHRGVADEAYSFNGSGYLVTDLSTQIDGQQKLTVEGWIKTISTTHDQMIGRWQNGGRSFLLNWFNNNRLYIYIAGYLTDTGGNSNVYASVSRDANWHYIAFVFDGTLGNSDRVKLYWDGQAQSTTVTGTIPTTLTIAGASYPMIIGNYEAGTDGPPHSGAMDFVKVHNTALTASEISTSYQATLSKQANSGPVEPTAFVPTAFRLYQNHPNPFNPITTIWFDIPIRTTAALTVYNLVGQKVAVLVDGSVEPGSHTITWDARALPSGIFLYELTAGGFVDRKKLLLLK